MCGTYVVMSGHTAATRAMCPEAESGRSCGCRQLCLNRVPKDSVAQWRQSFVELGKLEQDQLAAAPVNELCPQRPSVAAACPQSLFKWRVGLLVDVFGEK